MQRIARWLAVGALALGGVTGTALANQRHAQHKTTVDQLPAAVRSTFEKEARGGTIEDLRQETRKGKTMYEGEVVHQGKGVDLEVDEDGSLLKRSAAHDEATEHEQQK